MSESSSKDRAEPSALEEVGAAIKREGRQVADDARAAAQSMVSDQRDVLADYVAALADAASSGAKDLKDSGYPRSAATIERTAAEVGGFAERLQAREPGELWDDVEGFAREHPALVFGASFVVAFGVARFLKSSAASREEKQATASRPVSAGGA
ncbi:MAG: hypothetical protein ACFCUT_08405 [Kiloniellaceae bacterium]